MRARPTLTMLVTLIITMVLAGPSIADTSGSRWRVVQSPGGDGTGLVAIDFTVSVDGWTAGSTGISLEGNGVDTMIQHWNGTQWQVVDSLGLPQSDEALTGISASTSDDAWAVGWHDPYGTQRIHGLTLHWDGRQWSVTQDADHSPILRAVDARTPQDVWAVGVGRFEHYDGNNWSAVAPPRPDAAPNAVTVLAADDAWAVGTRPITRPGYHSTRPYLTHWDGSAWTSVRLPGPGTVGRLTGISAVSAHDIWAVGSIGSQSAAPFALHYNGVRWHRVTVPDAPEGAMLSGVAAISSDDVWAVGSQHGRLDDGFAVLRTFAEHWNGAAWHIVETVDDTRLDNWLGATAAVGDSVWAVGGDGDSLIERR